MEIRDIKFDEDVQKGMQAGAEKVYRAVKSTMGAKGRYVGIQTNFRENYATKDGYYTSQTIFLEDEIENMGAQMIKEVAKKSADSAGDGTTTSTVLAYNIYKLASEAIENGAHAIDVKKGIQKAVDYAVKEIKRLSIPVEGDMKLINQVATVSANNDETIGELIAEAYSKIKPEGIIHVEESKSSKSTIEVSDGMRINTGLISPYFINNPERMTCDLEDTYILLYDGTISTLKDILPVVEFISKSGGKSLLVVAMNIEQEALSTLIRNKMEGGMKVAAVPAPGFGRTKDTWLKDIEAVTGASIISEKGGLNLQSFVPEMLGSAKKVKVTEHSCEIVGGGYDEDALKERVNTIKNEIEESTQIQSTNFLKDRLARIDGGVAIIYVAATTEVELKEKKDLLEDAIAATKSASEEGILPGGGSALFHISESITIAENDSHGVKQGVSIVRQAMKEPFRTIMGNAGLEVAEMEKILTVNMTEFNHGFNLNTNEYCNMMEQGILDTAKVARMALENSSSVAGMMMMTNTLIYTKNPTV